MDYESETHFAMKFTKDKRTLHGNGVTWDAHISNRHKVSFVVQCRYTNKHGKHCKEISKFNNYKYQGEKQFFPRRKVNSKIKCSVPKQN